MRPKDLPKDLSVGWDRNQHGGTSGAHDFIKGAWKFEGSEKTKEMAYKIAEKYYDGFGVDITWETDSN